MWNVANYLLMKGRCTFLHISGVQEYGELLTYPEYRVPIGRPTAGPRKRGGVWWRAYSNGLVLVNPRNAAAEVRVDETYTDDSGRPITSPVRLSAHGAAILIPLSTAARR